MTVSNPPPPSPTSPAKILQALHHKTLRPPFPRERSLDNLAKFRRLLPQPSVADAIAAAAAAAAACTSTGTGTGTGTIPDAAAVRDTAGGRDSGGGSATAAALSWGTAIPRGSVAAAAAAAAVPGAPGAAIGRTSSGAGSPRTGSGEMLAAARGTTGPRAGADDAPLAAAAKKIETGFRSGSSAGDPQKYHGGGGSGSGLVAGHYRPPAGSATEIARMDKERASKRRSAELLLASDEAPAGTVTENISRITVVFAS